MWESFHDDSQSSRKSSFQLEEFFIYWSIRFFNFFPQISSLGKNWIG